MIIAVRALLTVDPVGSILDHAAMPTAVVAHEDDTDVRRRLRPT